MNAIEKLTEWLTKELAHLPEPITAVYFEFGEAYSSGMKKTIYIDGFGFEHLVDGEFDPRDREHIAALGDFVWETKNPCEFPDVDYPDVNWMFVLEGAANSTAVQSIVHDRKLLLLIGEHDDEVRVVS